MILPASDTTTFALDRLQDADAVLARHCSDGPRTCSCSRALPCSVVEGWRRHRAFFAQQLSLAALQTQEMPVVPGAAQAATNIPPRQRWQFLRTLFTLIRPYRAATLADRLCPERTIP